ncbi:MAG: hypothetical protein EPO21_03970 [Chloroflexota bacterium]|nr:MAG: hypothetical protein EPO21_03970 [Chloroflexota bacterium]
MGLLGLLGWLDAIWLSRYFEIDVALASMAIALWMGLYLLRRGAGTPVGLLGASALLFLALIYTFEAMLDAPGTTASQYELLLRTQALFVPSAISVWTGLAFLVKSQRRVTTTVKRVWLAIGIVWASQVWLRAFTNWHYDYAHIYPSPSPWQGWWTPAGPGFMTFAVLVVVGLVWSVYNIFSSVYDEVGSLRAIPSVRQFWPLFAGATLFLLGVGYLVVVYAIGIDAPEVIGLAGVTLGVVALGFGVFWHNAFVEEGRDITTDFLYSLAGMSGVMMLYAPIVYLADGFDKLGVGPVVALTAILVITHSLHDVAYRLFDSLLERVGLTRWTMGHRSRREMLLRAQPDESHAVLKERLAVLLDQLCREVSTNRGLVATCDSSSFIVQVTFGAAALPSRLTSPELVGESICKIPPHRQLGELKGMGIIVPLITQGRQGGVVVLGNKRYDDGEINRIIVHAEAMQRAIEMREVAEEIGRLERKLTRLQHQQQPAVTSADKDLVTICAKAGLTFGNVSEVIAAATDMLEKFREDPYALETNPFLNCTTVQSKLGRSRDRSQAVEILEDEIARTVASMKPAHQQGYDRRRWTYLHCRYIERYGKDGRRLTMEEIANVTGVSRKTLTRHHERVIREFVLAFLDAERQALATRSSARSLPIA